MKTSIYLILLAPVLAAVPAIRAAGDLPSGAGFAHRFPADRGLETHPAVIFSDNFEDGSLPGGWDSERNHEGNVLSLVRPSPADDRLGHRVLRVTAHLRADTGGGLTKWFTPVETVYIRFYTWFDPGSDYIHHFCTLRANQGLQGKARWSGFGGAGIKPNGDERFSTALEPWGNWGRWTPPGRWNFYSYWHEMKPARDGKYWGNAFRPEDQPDIKRGHWICAEFMLKHNTPGRTDGEQAFWIDGQLRGHWRQINWRKTSSLMANAFTLESYVTDRWTKNPTNIVCFDNVVIAREYIGPTGPGWE
jgi:hypothetical protein